jgi:hypothetical protein
MTRPSKRNFLFLSLLFVSMWMPALAADGAKIGGVSVVSPPRQVDETWVNPVKALNAGWVAIMPYAYSSAGGTSVRYNLSMQWWGERFEGTKTIIRHAKEKGLKVMLKPMLWVQGAWVGAFEMQTEKDWQAWEANYRKYLFDIAEIATAENVEMICIGTEMKAVAQKRPQFWMQLIADLRGKYCGSLTYAANWDDYATLPFWGVLDYIGVDAYFPLSPRTTPSVNELKAAWQVPFQTMQKVSEHYKKPILFTEFGYRSVDACSWKQWEIENQNLRDKVNLQSQTNAYRAFFETFWHQKWFAGVFLWQWYTNHQSAGGPKDDDYTIQNKPAASLITDWFAKPTMH